MTDDTLQVKWQLVIVTTLLAMVFTAAMAYVVTNNLVLSRNALENMNHLEEDNATMHLIVSTMPGGVAFADAETMAYTWCNEGFRQLTGRRSSGLYGRSMDVIGTPEWRTKYKSELGSNTVGERMALWRKLRTDPHYNPSLDILRPDGKVIAAKVTYRGVMDGGRRKFLMFIDPRITEEPDDGN